jgi:hypothetical protein
MVYGRMLVVPFPTREQSEDASATEVEPIRDSLLAEFNQTLLRAIEETIVGLTGPSVLNSLYANLQKFHSITRDMLPDNLHVLSGILTATFGKDASKVVSRRIAIALYARLRIRFSDIPSHSLTKYVEYAKRQVRRSADETTSKLRE